MNLADTDRLNMGRAKLGGVTRAPFISEDGGSAAQGACDTTGGRRVGAVVVDVGPDQDKAIQRAERKARTYGTALLVLASLLCLSVCGNLASSALAILFFKEFSISGATRPRAVVLSDPKAAAPVVTGLPSYGAEVRTYDKDTPADDTFPLDVSTASVPAVKKCAIALRSPNPNLYTLTHPIPNDLTSALTLTLTLTTGPTQGLCWPTATNTRCHSRGAPRSSGGSFLHASSRRRAGSSPILP